MIKETNLRNKHVIVFVGMFIAWWLVYRYLIVAHVSYALEFAIIFLMGFLTFLIMHRIFGRGLPRIMFNRKGGSKRNLG